MNPAAIASIIQAVAVIVGGGAALYRFGIRHGEDIREAKTQTDLLSEIRKEVAAQGKRFSDHEGRLEDHEKRLIDHDTRIHRLELV